jgi:hypothetical protein
MDQTLEMLDDVEEEVISRAFLYENANSFREGVEASLEAVRAMLARERINMVVAK